MTPQIAISKDYFDAHNLLPASIQKKASSFVEKFQRDPTSNAINYEKIERARDPKVRSVRVDQSYRAIVVAPQQGNIYMLVWVDKHDEAYRWAEKRIFDVDAGGAVIFYQVEQRPSSELSAPPQTQVTNSPAVGLLADYSDKQLSELGAPRALFPALRALQNLADFEELAPHLPATLAESLHFLLAGLTIEEILEELTNPSVPHATPVLPIEPTEQPEEPKDFLKALQHPDSQRSFRIIQSEEELAEMLKAPLEQWRLFLHPTQRQLVQQTFRGPARVLGGAGTGKTVVLMHRAVHLAERVFNAPGDRILVTTYTRNLAHDIAEKIGKLSPSAARRIDALNLHRFALEFLKKQGRSRTAAHPAVVEELWKGVASRHKDYSASFYQQEWERVVQAHDCVTREDYFAAPRVGRGTRLNRTQKAQLWTIFEEYRVALQKRNVVEWADIVRDARLLLEHQPELSPYRAVLADEVQDFRPADLKLLRAIAPRAHNDLFVIGDGHQRIYGHKASLGKAGIDVRGRSRNLKINYRTTGKIRSFAVSLLEGQEIDDLDDGVDSLKGYQSLRTGVSPDIHLVNTPNQELELLQAQLEDWLEDGLKPEEICLAARSGKQRDDYVQQLGANGLTFCTIDADGDSVGRPGIRAATMHRLKGLEFRGVVLAGVHRGSVPLPIPQPDQASTEDHLLSERCLFYVAATRARERLLVTGRGERSEFL